LLGKPILDDDILSLNPSKLAQLLPKGLQADRATGSSAIIQEPYAGNFPWLLRVCPRPAHGKRDDDCKKLRPFSILDPSIRLRTGFGFSIVGKRGTEPNSKFPLHLFFSLIENRQSKI
jgi:hypothetical protein